MRGHITKRGATWTYVIDVGFDEHGRRKQRSKGGFRTRREAQAALTEALTTIQHGTYTAPNRLTVGSFLGVQWLPSIRATVRPSTFASYSMHVRKYLTPGLGHIHVQKLGAPAINALYADMQLPAASGRRLSAASVRRVHATLHRALADAVRWQLLPRNPAATADPPRAPRPEMKVWTAEHLRGFLGVTADHQLHVLFAFYAFTGVRRGEALALRWEDVDLEGARASVRRSVVPVDHALVFGEPKTHKGRRSIALDPDLVVSLRAHRRRQLAERILMGQTYEDHDLVFARADGTPLHPEYVSRTFARLVRQSSLPAIRLHDLRHTHATLALSAGVAPRVLSDRLGHSAIAVTADVYQHVLPDLDADAAARIARLVRSGGESVPAVGVDKR